MERLSSTPSKIQPYCLNESDTLRQVIIGYPDNFHQDPLTVEVINQTQARYYGSEDEPTVDKLRVEFTEFQRAMEANGVVVYNQEPCPVDAGVPDQLTPRDVGFVIGERFFLASMARRSRKREWEGIFKILDRIPPGSIVKVPEDIVIEGGDIVVDKGSVFVGVSQRTTAQGVRFLRQVLVGTGFRVVPVHLKSIKEGEDCLHLDCVFVPVGRNHALIYPAGIQKVPAEVRNSYQWIEVTREEQNDLAINVLALSPTQVISRDAAVRVNRELERAGLEVIPLHFDEAPKTGGSFRCCTLPLVRSNDSFSIYKK